MCTAIIMIACELHSAVSAYSVEALQWGIVAACKVLEPAHSVGAPVGHHYSK